MKKELKKIVNYFSPLNQTVPKVVKLTKKKKTGDGELAFKLKK